jgi:AraC-like DNA-binding protein
MDNSDNIGNRPDTVESVLALIRENEAAHNRRMKELDEKFAESRAEFDRRLKEMNESINGTSKSNGLFAED